MHKQPEITEQTRKIFIATFCDLYMQKPIEKITVREITSIAGYNRSTFYQYFKDVYAVQESLENELISYVSTAVQDMSSQNFKMEDFVLCFVRMMTENMGLAQLLLGNPHNQHFQVRIKLEMMPVYMKIFNIPENNIRAKYTFEFYTSGIISALSRWLNHPGELTSIQLAELIHGILKDGIIAQI